MKLLYGDHTDHEYETITEDNEFGTKSLFLHGPFLGADKRNGNSRVYPLEVLKDEVDHFISTKVKNCNSVGELNHPPTPVVDLERACHLITEIKQDGNIFYGKSKILTSTPIGKVVHGLITDGVKVGMSSRALGDVDKSTGVVNKMKLITVDCVCDPSLDIATMDSIVEGKDWFLDDNGELSPESYEQATLKHNQLIESMATLPKHSDARSEHIAKAFLSFIQGLSK
tara:strand:- start:9782 stop:10462 length:681 start_codon:yes stop_codon:yes gene_type:complete